MNGTVYCHKPLCETWGYCEGPGEDQKSMVYVLRKSYAKGSDFCDMFCITRGHPFDLGSSISQYIDIRSKNLL